MRVENGRATTGCPGGHVEWVHTGACSSRSSSDDGAGLRPRRRDPRGPRKGGGGGEARRSSSREQSGRRFAGRVRLEAEGQCADGGARRARGVAAVASGSSCRTPGSGTWNGSTLRRAGAAVRRGRGRSARERFGVRTIEAGRRRSSSTGAAADPRRQPLRRVPRPRPRSGAGRDSRRPRSDQGDRREPGSDSLSAVAGASRDRRRDRPALHGGSPAQLVARHLPAQTAGGVRERSDRRSGGEGARANGAARRQPPVPRVWSMANECQTTDELGTRAMERLLARVHALDPTRLATYVANQNVEKNRAFALADLVAVNLYFGMWDGETADRLGEIEDRVFAPTREALDSSPGSSPTNPSCFRSSARSGFPDPAAMSASARTTRPHT